MRIDYKVATYNLLMYLLSVLVVFLLVQHSCFFYQWPPDITRWVAVPVYLYFVLGIAVFILLKFAHVVEVKGRIFEREKEEV